jgi:hypothetical protein
VPRASSSKRVHDRRDAPGAQHAGDDIGQGEPHRLRPVAAVQMLDADVPIVPVAVSAAHREQVAIRNDLHMFPCVRFEQSCGRPRIRRRNRSIAGPHPSTTTIRSAVTNRQRPIKLLPVGYIEEIHADDGDHDLSNVRAGTSSEERRLCVAQPNG